MNLKKLVASLLLFTQATNAFAIGQASTQVFADKIKSNAGGTVNTNASGTITVPNATDTLVGKATTDVFTNKSISGASNTLSSIADGSLTTPYIKADGTRPLTANWATGGFNFGNVNRVGYGFATQATAASTLTLSAASSRLQYFTGSTASQVVKLPATNSAGMYAPGDQFEFHNTSTQTIAVQDSAAGAITTQLAATTCWYTATTSASPGAWDSTCTPTAGGVTSVAMTVPSFLSIGGSPITTSGTLALTLSGTALPTANGGTNVTSSGTAGNALLSDGTNWTSGAINQVQGLRNLGITTSVGSSALTIALKQADGSTNCSATAPCLISFNGVTAAHPNGSLVQRTLAAASSLVVPSTTTLGSSNGLNYNYYVYAIDNAGTIEPAISMAWFDCTNVVTTTTMPTGASNNRTMYSTTGRTSVACRIIGQIQANEATAGTWATNASDVSVGSYKRIMPHARTSSASGVNVGGTISTGYNVVKPVSSTVSEDNFNSYAAGTGQYTVPEAGQYVTTCTFDAQGTYTAGQYSGIRCVGGAAYGFVKSYGSVTSDFVTTCISVTTQAVGDTMQCDSISQASSVTFGSGLSGTFVIFQKVSD